MLINSHNPAGILRSPASYICHDLHVTCTKLAQSLCVRFCAARKALTASALGNTPRGLRLGWFMQLQQLNKILSQSTPEMAGLRGHAQTSLQKKNQRLNTHCHPILHNIYRQFQHNKKRLSFFLLRILLSFSFFAFSAPVPRGAVGSVLLPCVDYT